MANTIFPASSNYTTALSEEPLLLNGMKVIFDQSAAVYPVSLQHRSVSTQFSISAFSDALGIGDHIDGLLPKEYKEKRDAVLTLRGKFTGLGLTPISDKYKKSIRNKDYEKAYFLWQEFKEKVDSLSQTQGRSLLKDGNKKRLLLKDLSDAYTEAEEYLLHLSGADTNAKTKVPSHEESINHQSNGIGMYGQITPREHLSDSSEKSVPERLLEEAREYEAFFQDYPAFQEDSQKLAKLLEDYIQHGKPTVQDRIAIEKLLTAIRNAAEDIRNSAEELDDVDQDSEIRDFYNENLIQITEIQRRIDAGEEVGSGKKMLVAKQVGKKVVGGTLGYVVGFDPTRASKAVLEIGKAANRILRTNQHIKALKKLQKAESQGITQGITYPNGWQEITAFIIHQKTAKMRVGVAGVATIVPGVGYVISGGVEVHNRQTKSQREEYAEKLINWYREGDQHAGLIILELVGVDKFRTVINNRQIDVLAVKMQVV